MTEIAYCKIHPGIGVARLGDSPDQFFVGPEAPGVPVDPVGGFKDGAGRVKRQASRFRVFAYDAQDTVVQELTAADATITWSVHLANKKASWYQFYGLAAEEQARTSGSPLPLRNASVLDRTQLEIDAGPRTITGTSTHGSDHQFTGGSFRGTPVALGELQTDDAGRLLVLGGAGTSDTIDPANAIRSYANNNDWYDDTSDGPVTATVVLTGGQEVPVTGSSWVIVAPPDFSPATDNIITLYDVIEDVAVQRGWLTRPAAVSFTRDVYPMFARLAGYQWVNAAAMRGHGPGGPAAFMAQLAVLADKTAAGAPLRRRVFERIRSATPADDAEAQRQANATFMPQLSGDGGDQTVGDASTWLRLLPAQFDALRRWADGDFDADWAGPPSASGLEQLPLADRPGALARAVLEHCVGGPFFPGIEMTYIARDPDLYTEAFRLRSDLEPGDVTKRMAVPWQADFYQCNTHWWPAQRPDDVVTEAQYAAVLKAFEVETADPDGDPAALLGTREAWARGVDQDVYVPRPVVPRKPGETDEQYAARAQAEWDRRRALAGDDGLVQNWSKLGFVTARTMPSGHQALVETDRDPYFALSDREGFHIMLNIESHPDYLPTAAVLAQRFLDQAASLQDYPNLPDDWRHFDYTPEAYAARLDKIYNGLVAAAEAYSPGDQIFKTRADVVERIRQLAPFNQLDGAWLRGVTAPGPIDDIHALLFAIWADEVGNGVIELNHANLYTDLLHDVGIYLDDITTQAYAENPDMLDSAYTHPLFQLVVSQFSQRYFPELLGMTLNLEWEVVQLKTTIKLFEYFGLDAQFYKMHVGIDNAVSGHGAQARRAIELYLDRVRTESGDQEMQAVWRRIWNGYVAFATTGNLGQDLRDRIVNPPSLTDRVVDLVNRKAPYARRNHGDKRLGANLINDWFDDPYGLLQALLDTGTLVAGDPDNSPFFALLRYDGPMYKVFTEEEIKLWTDWTRSLSAAPAPSGGGEDDIAQDMAKLVDTMRLRQTGTAGHGINQLTGPAPDNPAKTVTQTVAWWFEQPTSAFLTALANAENNWVVSGDAAHSRFITDLASGNGPMALALGGVVPGSPHRTWRSIAFDWINQGCPIPPPTQAPAVAMAAIAAAAAPAVPVPRLTLSSPTADLAAPTARIFGNGVVH